MRPACTEIRGLPYGGTEPGIAAAGIDRACFGVCDHMIDWPGLAIGAAKRPGCARAIALGNESALLRPNQQQSLVRHVIPPSHQYVKDAPLCPMPTLGGTNSCRATRVSEFSR